MKNRMEIKDFSACSQTDKDKFLQQMQACDWAAAKFLAQIIREERFEATLGGYAKLFMLTDNGSLVSFVTLSAQDCVVAPDLSPALWLGFFFTVPAFRGNRYGKQVIDYACGVAEREGFNRVYLATDHVNLYEKYGFTYLENRVDIYDEDSRIYFKNLQ